MSKKGTWLPSSPFGHQTEIKVRKGQNYILTPLGKQKADAYELSGVKFDVLAHLADKGPSTIGEISNGTHLEEVKVRAVLKELIRSGYVRQASVEGI